MRRRLSTVFWATAIALALGACDGHATRDVPEPTQVAKRAAIGEGPEAVVTKVCGHPIVRLQHRVVPVSLIGRGVPVRLHGRACGGHVSPSLEFMRDWIPNGGRTSPVRPCRGAGLGKGPATYGHTGEGTVLLPGHCRWPCRSDRDCEPALSNALHAASRAIAHMPM
jgi:hypothetical protein